MYIHTLIIRIIIILLIHTLIKRIIIIILLIYIYLYIYRYIYIHTLFIAGALQNISIDAHRGSISV